MQIEKQTIHDCLIKKQEVHEEKDTYSMLLPEARYLYKRVCH